MKLNPAYIAAQVLTCGFDYNGTLTTCTLTLKNGFKSVGYSSCMDPRNYDKEFGEQAAHKQALDKLWEHESYFFYKLGLTTADIDPAKVVASVDAGHDGCAVSVMVVCAKPLGEPAVVNTNTSILHFDSESLAKHIADMPQFSRDVISSIVLKSKAKLGLPSMAAGGFVPGSSKSVFGGKPFEGLKGIEVVLAQLAASGQSHAFRVPAADKPRLAVKLRDAGFSYSEIGHALSVSKQHAHRLVKAGT